MDDMFHIYLITKQNLYKVIRKFKKKLRWKFQFLVGVRSKFPYYNPISCSYQTQEHT